MNYRLDNTIRIFRTIRDMKPSDDPSLAIDAFMDTPASDVHDITLEQFDRDFDNRIDRQPQHSEHLPQETDDYSEEDFIDPDSSSEVTLSEDEESEIALKMTEIDIKVRNILTSMDLRLYGKDKFAVKKGLYNDMYQMYFSEYEYIPQNVRQSLAVLISRQTDKAFAEVMTPHNRERISMLFRTLMNDAEPYIDSQLDGLTNASPKYAKYLYDATVRQWIEPSRRSMHYSDDEYQTICRMTKSMIDKKIAAIV